MIRMTGAHGLKSADTYDSSPSIEQATHVQINFGEYDANGKPTNFHTVVIEAGQMLLVLLLAKGYERFPEALELSLRLLQQAAEQGKREIENGDVYRPELKDTAFTAIIPQSIEEVVIAEMARGDKWMRGTNGWWLKDA